MNNETKLNSGSNPAQILLNLLQKELTSQKKNNNEPKIPEVMKEEKVKYQEPNKSIDLTNPFYSRRNCITGSIDFRKKIAFFEESVNPKKPPEIEKKNYPLLKKISIKEKDQKFKNTIFKDNIILQEAFSSIIKKVAKENKINFEKLRIKKDNNCNQCFSLFGKKKQFNNISKIIQLKVWSILITNKIYYELETEYTKKKESEISKKNNSQNQFQISSLSQSFICSNTNNSLNKTDILTMNIKNKDKPQPEFEIFLKSNLALSNGQSHVSPVETEENVKENPNKQEKSKIVHSPPSTHHKQMHKIASSCSVDKIRNPKKYQNLLEKKKLAPNKRSCCYLEGSSSKKATNRFSSVDSYLSNKLYSTTFSQKNNGELILYLYDIFSKIEKFIKESFQEREDYKSKLYLKLKNKIHNVILQVKKEEKEEKRNEVSEFDEIKNEEIEIENGKCNEELYKSYLILVKIFDLPSTIFGNDKEENFINDIHISLKKNEKKLKITDLSLQKIKSFFDILFKKLKINVNNNKIVNKPERIIVNKRKKA